MTNRDLVEGLADVWASLLVLWAELRDDEWAAASMLPGWTVHDVYAHITHTEEMLLGREVPDHVAPPADHVRNELGRYVENGVDFYRSWAHDALFARFAEVTDARLAALRDLSDADFEDPIAFPLGNGTIGSVLPFRLVDCWIHEQDVRVALDRPGGWDTNVSTFVIDRMFGNMGKVVAKLVGAPDGTVVVFRIGAHEHSLEVVDGRGQLADETNAPNVVLVMEPDRFLALATGRGDAASHRSAVTVEGDAALGARILEQMNVMI